MTYRIAIRKMRLGYSHIGMKIFELNFIVNVYDLLMCYQQERD